MGVGGAPLVRRVIETAIGLTSAGTEFVFGPLVAKGVGFVLALQVLPVIIFLGAIIGGLSYLRFIQVFVDIVGGLLGRFLGVSKVESVWASTVIFLGQSEAPLVIAPYLRGLTTSQLFTGMTGGFAAAPGRPSSATRRSERRRTTCSPRPS